MKSIEKTKNVGKDETKFLQNWYIWAIIMAGLTSLLLIVIFWCTNIFQNIILSNLIIQNGTRAFEYWIRPPVQLVQNFYIYNYTNVDDFESGKANKLRVQQLGPYIYEETLTRINTQIHENAVHSVIRNLNYASQFIFNFAMSTLNIKPFINITAGGYLWGYDDDFYDLLKTFGYIRNPSDKFGILIQSHGVLKDRLMINTGIHDMDNLGIIQGINGKNILNIWGDEECDKIAGTDGSMFPPKWIKNRNIPLHVYIKEFCKTFNFNFHEYSNVQGVPSFKYKLSLDSFQESSKETCFCPKITLNSNERKCPPIGTLNISTCYENLPIILSLPHFYGADKSLIESIDGLKPEQNLHESTLDLHQFLALVMNGTLRMQLNMEFKKVFGAAYSNKLKDNLILPLIWSESTLDVLPEDFINEFYDAHFANTIIEATFRWGSTFIFLSSICALYLIKRNHYIDRSNV
ncbi:PREDICTED: sensory neuron membrane protein 2-like isoform X2 [Polistes canadensis]|uniref:sensory neuron membrane protein 2-like isoform X2 n=1 Tax=Polistes canadensis TaxID=91411 RepID=UPI000718C189|nr:PREDICTED: sensory neuron membrane protein 2-like isoform X2 [Polistes canadensis]